MEHIESITPAFKKLDAAGRIEQLTDKIAEIAVNNDLNLFVIVADFICKIDTKRYEKLGKRHERKSV
jgi:hypothetical protein